MRYRKQFIQSGFYIGQIVNVINNSKCYNIYGYMAHKLQLSNFNTGELPSTEKCYNVIHINRHPTSRDFIITIKELLDGHEFMMVPGGIKGK